MQIFALDLLRVIRMGHSVKNAVDDAIDQCAEVFNLRDSIEQSRMRAEQVQDERSKKQFAQKGMYACHTEERIIETRSHRAAKPKEIFRADHFSGLSPICRARHDAVFPHDRDICEGATG